MSRFHCPIWLCLVLLTASAAGAQSAESREEDVRIGDFDDFDELYLGQLLDVVFTAAKHEQEIGESPSAITVITRADIEASGASSIPDLLRQVPGMDVIITSPMIAGIMARMPWGNENNQFLVLIDGREVNLELLGMSLWELEPISLDDIERIEIIRGPGSALYGANAVAGVINITTKPIADDARARIHFQAGEIGKSFLQAGASTRIDGWGFSVAGIGDRMGAFTDPGVSSKRLWKFRALIERRWSESRRLLIDAGLTDASGLVAIAVGSFEGSLSMRTLRLAYESEELRGHLYWTQVPVSASMEAALDYSGIRLAEFVPFDVDAHTINGEVQWTPPRFWEPLLLILGGGGRVTYLSSDQMLDAEAFNDVTSESYHQPGITHWEGRAGAFVHSELKPADWVTVTGGLRFDYNTETAEFLSPRISAVFKPAPSHYLRLGAGRAFRKPAFIETRAHLMVEFPEDSPITGDDMNNFLEFMTRVIGNSSIDNEKLLSFEAGYLGRFLNDRLSLALDLYYNIYSDMVHFESNIVEDQRGLPDLARSSFMHSNREDALDIFGSELTLRFNPSKNVALLASWAYREALNHRTRRYYGGSPQNLITLGGRFHSGRGLLGGLYVSTRSEFLASGVQNPAGLLEPLQNMNMETAALILARLGWRWSSPSFPAMEAGLKVFLPVSLVAHPRLRYREDGGGVTATGRNYGADELRRMVLVYLQGSF